MSNNIGKMLLFGSKIDNFKLQQLNCQCFTKKVIMKCKVKYGCLRKGPKFTLKEFL